MGLWPNRDQRDLRQVVKQQQEELDELRTRLGWTCEDKPQYADEYAVIEALEFVGLDAVNSRGRDRYYKCSFGDHFHLKWSARIAVNTVVTDDDCGCM